MQQTVPSDTLIQRYDEGAVVLYADPRRVPLEGVRELFGLPDVLRALQGISSRSKGRETVWRWAPAWFGAGRLVVRQFAHGGLLGPLWGTMFWSRRPMLRELQIAMHALSRGVPTCRPIALRLEKAAGFLFRAHYLTEEIPEARNLLELCRNKGGESRWPPVRRQRLAYTVARVLASMHDAGICHGDLNLKNLLVAERDREDLVYVIDLKKARLKDRVSLRERLRNLKRLDRSVVKWPESRRGITVFDRIRTLRAYLRLQPEAAENWKEVARTMGVRRPERP